MLSFIYRPFSTSSRSISCKFNLCHRDIKYEFESAGNYSLDWASCWWGTATAVFFAKTRCRNRECIKANKSKFLLKVSEGSRLRENPSDRQVYHGNCCILEGHKKTDTLFIGWIAICQGQVRCVKWISEPVAVVYTVRAWVQLALSQTNNTLVWLYVKRQGGMWCFKLHNVATWWTIFAATPIETLIKSNLGS